MALVKSIKHTYVLMVHVAQQLDFPQRPLGVDVVVERIANLLDRNLLPYLRVDSRAETREQPPKCLQHNKHIYGLRQTNFASPHIFLPNPSQPHQIYTRNPSA